MTALSHTPHVRMRTWELLRIMPHVLQLFRMRDRTLCMAQIDLAFQLCVI